MIHLSPPLLTICPTILGQEWDDIEHGHRTIQRGKHPAGVILPEVRHCDCDHSILVIKQRSPALSRLDHRVRNHHARTIVHQLPSINARLDVHFPQYIRIENRITDWFNGWSWKTTKAQLNSFIRPQKILLTDNRIGFRRLTKGRAWNFLGRLEHSHIKGSVK